MNKTFLLTAALPLVLASAATAQTISINFNDVQPGTVVNTTYTTQGVTFTGEGGAFYQQVQAIDGGYDQNGSFVPFASNALDATPSNVDVALNAGLYGTSFDIDLLAAPNGYGSASQFVTFYDAANNLVGSVSVDQTANTHIAYAPTSANGYFTTVVLPPDAYYDNLSIAAAPEPSAWAGLMTGAFGLLALRVKARRRA